MAETKITDNETASDLDGKAVVLFNGTPARVVTISEAYTNFSRLIVVYHWGSYYGTVVLDTSVATQYFAVIREGSLDGAYKIQVGGGLITLSGTTVSGSAAAGIYTIDLRSDNVHAFRDNVGDLTIVKVTGIK